MLVARIEVLGEIDERGAVRFTVDQESMVRGMNGEPVSVVVENFSRTGFLFSGDVDFPVRTFLSIGVGSAGAREAQVIWSDGAGRHGCEFLVPIARRDMEKAFRSQQSVVAELQAKLAQRFGTPVAPEDEPPHPPGGRLARLLKRRDQSGEG